MSRPLDWDAGVYDRVADPQERWAREVLARIEWRGDEIVLDAGCGSGRVTRLLLEAVPAGRVIAVDGSARMVQQARMNLGEAAQVEQQDLLELQLAEQVDVVFSTAVFHHISDHARLFERCRAALVPGGRLIAQCGGAGNIDAFRSATAPLAKLEPYAEHIGDLGSPWHYAAPEETERLLHEAGFTQARCWLQPMPTTIEDAEPFLRSVLLNYHLAKLPPELHDGLVAKALELVGEPMELDYVRLNIEAK